MQGIPISLNDFSCMRRIIFAHVNLSCATLKGTLSSEPTLYLPITVSSICSLRAKPFLLFSKSVTTSMVISHICPTFSSRVILPSHSCMWASISGSEGIAAGVCATPVRHVPAHNAEANAMFLNPFISSFV